MKELLKKYVNSGATPTKHQLEYIFNRRSLFVSLVRKQLINKNKKFFSYNLVIIGEAIKKDFFNEKLRNDILNYIAPIENIGPLFISIIKYGKNVPEDVQLNVISKDGRAIKYLLNNEIIPYEAVQLAAVSNHGYAIKYILDKGITPSKDVQLAAVKLNPEVINYIKNPHPSVINYVNSLKK